MKVTKICVITGSRSEYGLMRWLMEDLKQASDFQLQVIVTGSHLSEDYGLTFREIEADGFCIDAKIPFSLKKSDTISLGSASGQLTGNLVKTLSNLEPDLVMVMGDRYELLSVLTACVIATIPIAHISGGEITEGAIDDQIRHAMTKVSHLHYVANDVYAERIHQMGEEKWRVCISGEPGLDNLHRQPIMMLKEFQKDLGLDLSKPTALVTYHPVTLETHDLDWQMDELTNALDRASKEHQLQYLITFPNADTGSKQIIRIWEKFVNKRSDRVLIKSLGQTRYLTALRFLTMMIGNSSSGLVEAPSFNMPVVNIGNRQKGRMKGKNVFDVDYNHLDILKGITRAFTWDRNTSCINPYGNGKSSEKILTHLRHILSNYDFKQLLLHKKFIDSNEVIESESSFYSKHGE